MLHCLDTGKDHSHKCLKKKEEQTYEVANNIFTGPTDVIVQNNT